MGIGVHFDFHGGDADGMFAQSPDEVGDNAETVDESKTKFRWWRHGQCILQLYYANQRLCRRYCFTLRKLLRPMLMLRSYYKAGRWNLLKHMANSHLSLLET
jgi:hypothetical protein